MQVQIQQSPTELLIILLAFILTIVSYCIKREISLFYNYFGELSSKAQENPLSVSQILGVLAKLGLNTAFSNSRFGFFIIISPDR